MHRTELGLKLETIMDEEKGRRVKLDSGRTVQLFDVTFNEREEAENVITTVPNQDGSVKELRNQTLARNLWCQFGLRCEKEELNIYSTEELVDIMSAVMRRALKGTDPTKQDS